MPLLLKTVSPARGLNWLRDAFRLFLRRPLAFTALFAVFLLAALVLSLVPLLGAVLPFALSPLLSLGFMVASQSALLDGPVHPGQFIEPLRTDAVRRRALLQLCALYALLLLLVMALGAWVADGAFERLQTVMADPKASSEAVLAAVGDPALQHAVLLTALLLTLLSVPFWHAPALVHWGSQGVAQSLFSSTLAIWRCKGAFAVYSAAWGASFLGFSVALALVGGLLGLGGLVSTLAAPLAMAFTTVFYVSLIFAFNDSFGGASPVLGETA